MSSDERSGPEAWPPHPAAIDLQFHVFRTLGDLTATIEPGTKVRTNPPGKAATYVCTVKHVDDDGSMVVVLEGADLTLPADHDVQILSDGADSGHVKTSMRIEEPKSVTVFNLKEQLFKDALEAKLVVQFVVMQRILDDAMTLDQWPLGVSTRVRVAITEWPRYDPEAESFGRAAYSESGGVRPIDNDSPGRYIISRDASVYSSAESTASGRTLASSAKITISNVVWVVKISRVRGYIEDQGWITLLDLACGVRWAERAPIPLLGDTVLVLGTDHVRSTNLNQFFDTHVKIKADTGKPGLRYSVEGSEEMLSEDDVDLVEKGPCVVVSLQLISSEDASKCVTCLSLGGNILSTVDCRDRETVLELRHRIARSLQIPLERLQCILPDGRLLGHLDRAVVEDIFEIG